MISVSTCAGCRAAEARAFPAWIFFTKTQVPSFLH